MKSVIDSLNRPTHYNYDSGPKGVSAEVNDQVFFGLELVGSGSEGWVMVRQEVRDLWSR